MDEQRFFIEIAAPEHASSELPLILYGKFSAPLKNGGFEAKGTEVLKHIVLVVTRSGNYQALAPFKEVIAFADDVKETEDGYTGFFNFNIFEKIAFDGEGEYYFLCSLGTMTSNIVKTTVKVDG